MSETRTIGVAVAVVSRHGSTGRREYLVGRRPDDAIDGPGLDEFPGGKIEPGETPADAAARECLEESGLTVSVGGVLDRASGSCKAGPIEVWFLTAAPTDATPPQPPFAWVDASTLSTLRFPETNRRVLDAIGGAHGGS